MKKQGIAIALAFVMGLMSLQSCVGGGNGFVVTKKLYNWNSRLGNKWVNEIVFLIMVIIPVYGIAVLVDGIILNSVDFWTGSNPLAMKPGEVETKYITEGDKSYKVEVSLNRMHFQQITGPNMGEEAELVYNPETKTWLLGNGKELKKAVQMMDGNEVKVFKKDGNTVIMSKDAITENLDKLMPEKI